MNTHIIILAAGKGTRMKSDLPKVAHRVGGLPMVQHVVACAGSLAPSGMTVVTAPGEEGEQVQKLLPGDMHFTVQAERLGTGHAVQGAVRAMQQKGITLDETLAVAVLYGDTPLIRPQTIAAMRQQMGPHADTAVVVLGFTPADPAQYGRLVCENGYLQEIVEFAEATPEQKAIRLCNAGIMLFRGTVLETLLPRLSNANAKGEYYLTDMVALARQAGHACRIVEASEEEVLGVNSRVELAQAEAILQQRLRRQAMEQGVTLVAPETVFLSVDTTFGRDCVVEPFVTIGQGVTIGSRVTVRAYSHLEGATVGDDSIAGPYARLRPGAVLEEQAHVGNFVEIKNTRLGKGSKANHLTYLGDTTVGEHSNIGAGTITCNYDGYNKTRTVIGHRVFIGSDSALVAPVTIGDDAVVAAGSVITGDVPAGALSISRAAQQNREEGGLRYHQARRGNRDKC